MITEQYLPRGEPPLMIILIGTHRKSFSTVHKLSKLAASRHIAIYVVYEICISISIVVGGVHLIAVDKISSQRGDSATYLQL